jgi:hypothetical protein
MERTYTLLLENKGGCWKVNYKDALEKILKSEWAEKQREVYEDEELSEMELKEALVEDFFYEDLGTILKVLPELWEEIKEEVEMEVASVLDNPKNFEDALVSRLGRQELVINFSLNDFLDDVCEEVEKVARNE